MKRVWLVVALCSVLGVSYVVHAEEAKHNYKPSAGVVPNAQTAIAIAVAVWSPIYGQDHIKKQAPFHVKLRKGVWFVEGTLPKRMMGGVAEIEIARVDGRIIRISHGR